jgi:glycosyltransferase involved in cell wall biosynthesis
MRHSGPESVLQIVGSIREYGAENFVPLLSRELDRLGVSVAILTVRGPVAESAGVVRVLTAGRRSRWDLGFFFRMIKIIRQHQPTVVHTHGYHGKLWGRLAARMAGIRTIVHTEHNSDFRSHVIQRIVNCALNRSTDAVVTFSDVLAARLVNEDCVPLDRIVVIPNGVAPPERKPGKFALRAQPPIEKGTKVILHVGRLMKVKNQQLAIRVCRELRDLHPNQHFCVLFAGSGEDEHALKELAATLGVSDRVRFLGYRNDVDDIMRRCNVVLLTSLNEAMPLTVLEAMYAGTPIVTTPWHGASELLEGGKLGCVTASYDPKVVATALSLWLGDRDGTMRAADAAYFAVRSRFDIRITARQHAALYARFNLAD